MTRLFILLIFPFSAFTQDYRASLIPDSLLQNANAVKRLEDIRVTIKGVDRAVVRRRFAVTVINAEGEDFARYGAGYSKLETLTDISGRLFDKEGKLVRTVKRKEIEDIPLSDEATLLTDSRAKLHTFYCKSYPYTVEYEDEIDYHGLLFLPTWNPVGEEGLAVQQSRLVVETPGNYQLRFRQMNNAPQAVVTQGNITTYAWELRDFKAVINEPLQPDWQELLPQVYIAASSFAFEGYQGSMVSWSELGRFFGDLYKGRDVLPENIRSEVHRLTDPLSNRDEKIKALYNYLQQNTRYVSVQLGIGGWQPFDAKYVAEKKYGDCKALSNYMTSLLHEAGIASYPVIIKAGSGKKGLLESFPAPYYFNHVIVCAPAANDTVWLECTDQDISPGFLSSFTSNRKALMLTPGGGVVVQTPDYTLTDNKMVRRVTATINQDGQLHAEVNTHTTGLQQETAHSLYHAISVQQRNDYLNRTFNLPTYQVENISYQETKGVIPAMDEHIVISSDNYASITGRRLFIIPNLFTRNIRLKEDRTRRYAIEYRSSFCDLDSITISIPEGYRAESVPKEIDLNSIFGIYRIRYRVEGGRIEVYRFYERHAGLFPASEYARLVEFYEAMYQADRAKIVLVRADV